MLNGIIKMIARFIYKWVVYFTVTFINIVSPPIPKKEQKILDSEKKLLFLLYSNLRNTQKEVIYVVSYLKVILRSLCPSYIKDVFHLQTSATKFCKLKLVIYQKKNRTPALSTRFFF